MELKQPQCKSPHHPGDNRDTMLLVDENTTHFVFACSACKDVNKVLSVQVRTKPEFRAHVREQIQPYKQARQVDKRLGRITYFR